MTIFDASSPFITAAAPPWTYWMAPVLFVSTLLLAVATAVGYYRKVAVPAHLMRQQSARQVDGRHPSTSQPAFADRTSEAAGTRGGAVGGTPSSAMTSSSSGVVAAR